MAEYILRDRPQELCMQIEQLHLTYLQTEDVPEKHDLRKKLEGIIINFVSLVPHNRKFCFRETANVLHRSAATKEDFTGYGAASAWASLALYASNLLSQPWRKEYRELELYCGFYKHEISANLVGAEVMLEEMGYKHTGNMTMVMDWPIDPDQVKCVSRDSLVAFVECQLMKTIWEEVSLNFPCSWLDVLEYRETHVGTWDQAVQGLVYLFRQRLYHDQQQQLAAYHHHDVYRYHQPAASCVYGPSTAPPPPHSNYCNYNTYGGGGGVTNGYGVAPRYAAHPQHVPYAAVPVSGYATYHPHLVPHVALKPQDQYPGNGHHPASNGYGGHPAYGCVVPTAQLIELDPATPPQSNSSESQMMTSPTDSSSSALASRAAAVPRQTQQPAGRRTDKPRTHKADAKDDGTGTFDSWDYVYRNLEIQGLKKNVGDRPDILSAPYSRKGVSTLPNPSEEARRVAQQKNQELEEALMDMRLAEFERKTVPMQSEGRPMKFDEVLHKIRLEGDGEPAEGGKTGLSTVDGCDTGSLYDNMSSPPNEKAFTIVPSKPTSMNQSNKATTKTLPRESANHRSEKNAAKFSSATLDPRRAADRSKQKQISSSTSTREINKYNEDSLRWQEDVSPMSQLTDSPDEPVSRLIDPSVSNNNVKWECITCTYLNAASHEVCEMCGKSKNRGPETIPLASGGRECPQCTLVNEKGIGLCEACGCSLKGSPTYI